MFKPTVSKDYVHIYSQDPAIDTSLPSYDHTRWMETGKAELLPLKPGSLPVRFTLRHLGGRARAVLTDQIATGAGAQTYVEAVSLALVSIENGQLDNGEPFDAGYTVDNRDKMRRCDDDTITKLFTVDEGALLIELGNRVIAETFGNPT